MKGLFIAFEGSDGCGKSTQIRYLTEYLAELGLDVVQTREPGGSPIAEKIREVILDCANTGMAALTEALLYAAARAEHVRQVIKPALEAGKIVLCDRFVDSSIAYQGFGRSLGAKTVWRINEPAVDGCMPDVTVFMNVPPERAFARMNENKQYDRLESEDMSFHQRVYEAYIELSKKPGVIVIDAVGTKYETRDIVRERIEPVLKEAGLL
jgi:dTMP kinase